MQQYIIVLATYLFVILNTTWIPAVVSAFCHVTHRHGRPSAKATAERISKRITSRKQTDTLVTALLDFQKSQLFFSAALQVACLYAVYTPAILSARTFRELESGFLLLTLVGVSGVYPVALNLLSIRAGRKKPDLFTFLLTICAVALASANWLLSASSTMEQAQLAQDGFNPLSCGGMNPQKYCVRPNYTIAKYLEIDTAVVSWQTDSRAHRTLPGRHLRRHRQVHYRLGSTIVWTHSDYGKLGSQVRIFHHANLAHLWSGRPTRCGQLHHFGQINLGARQVESWTDHRRRCVGSMHR
jgi:hypothetical protein